MSASAEACVMLSVHPCPFSRHGGGACMCNSSSCAGVCARSVCFVYEASPGQCSVPESSRTASVKTISTHTVLAAHKHTPSPRTDRQIAG